MAEEPPRGSYAIKYVCMYVCMYVCGNVIVSILLSGACFTGSSTETVFRCGVVEKKKPIAI